MLLWYSLHSNLPTQSSPILLYFGRFLHITRAIKPVRLLCIYLLIVDIALHACSKLNDTIHIIHF